MRDIANAPASTGTAPPGQAQVRPYRLLGASLLEHVAALCGRALADWRAEWGVAAGAVAMSCTRAADQAGLEALAWRQCHTSSGTLWLAWPAGWQGAVAQALFAPDSAASAGQAGTSLAGAAAQAACDQLRERLVELLLPAPGAPASAVPQRHVWRQGEGSVLVRVAAGAQALCLLLDGGALAALLARHGIAAGAPAAPALARRPDYAQLLHALPLRLTVQTGRVQLSLGSLASAGVGDVIRLDAAIDAPVSVLGPGGQPLLRAYLGQSDGQAAVEVSGRAAPASN